MVASNCARLKGKASVPASAPNSTALITLPVSSAACAISKPMKRAAAPRADANNAALSARPSPMAVFSAMAYTRCVEATMVVRSGVTSPRCTARAASISSEAMTMSTSPGSGIKAMTGCACASPSMSIST